MNLIPYLTFSVSTTDRVSVVMDRLVEKVDRVSWFPALPYSGDVWNGGFKIVPVISYRNSFLPVICGAFEGHANYTIVHITMRIHWAVVGFLCFWCVMVGSAFLTVLESVMAGDTSWAVLLVPAFMLMFAVGLAVGAFWWEVPQRRDDITRVLVGTG
jgi:hypothetical protein